MAEAISVTDHKERGRKQTRGILGDTVKHGTSFNASLQDKEKTKAITKKSKSGQRNKARKASRSPRKKVSKSPSKSPSKPRSKARKPKKVRKASKSPSKTRSKGRKCKKDRKASTSPSKTRSRGRQSKKGRKASTSPSKMRSKSRTSKDSCTVAPPTTASLLPKRKIAGSTSQNISVPRNRIVLAETSKAEEKEPLEDKNAPSSHVDKDLYKNHCTLSGRKPTNVETEKVKFFNSGFTYNPQFKYKSSNDPEEVVKHSHPSGRFLQQAIKILKKTLEKYGTYEKFAEVEGGKLMTKHELNREVQKYMKKEGCQNEVVVQIRTDLLSHASMTTEKGWPTMKLNLYTAREKWLEGTLRHELGTHYFRKENNNQQPWRTKAGRQKHGLNPVNPTEEGLASIHSVLYNKDPYLWRAALLYYAVYQGSRMSFSELFKDMGQFVQDPKTRWYYCLRVKRGLSDTSKPGCLSKDQVYLDGILYLLRYRKSIDFRMLTSMGKISYEDVERLKGIAVMKNARIPHFLQNSYEYMENLERIMKVNGLTDKELKSLIG